jgi:hypothetical protein
VVDATLDATGVANAIVEAEVRVRAAAPFRTVIYLEPRVRS